MDDYTTHIAKNIDNIKSVILTDLRSRNALIAAGKKLHNITFPWGMNSKRNIPFKIGNNVYLLYNNGRNPFSIESINDKTLLLYPEPDFWKMKGVDIELDYRIPEREELNEEFNLKSATKYVTIPISEETPRYYLGEKSKNKDIRIVFPFTIVGQFMKLGVIDILDINENNIIIREDLGVVTKYMKNFLYPVIAFDKYDKIICLEDKFRFFFENSSTVDPVILNLCESDNVYYINNSTADFKTIDHNILSNKDSQDEFKHGYLLSYFRAFEADYHSISFFKIGNDFFRQGTHFFDKIKETILSFRYVCIKMKIDIKEERRHLLPFIIYEVRNNEINFSCEIKIKLINTEVNAKKLIEEEIEEKKLQEIRENEKKKKEELKLKKIEEKKLIGKLKEYAKKLAYEAKDFVDKKNKIIKQIQDKIIKEFINDILSEEFNYLTNEIASEIIQQYSPPTHPLYNDIFLNINDSWLI